MSCWFHISILQNTPVVFFAPASQLFYMLVKLDPCRISRKVSWICKNNCLSFCSFKFISLQYDLSHFKYPLLAAVFSLFTFTFSCFSKSVSRIFSPNLISLIQDFNLTLYAPLLSFTTCRTLMLFIELPYVDNYPLFH